MIILLLSSYIYRIDLEEKYNTLAEEAHGKTKKIKKIWSMLNAAKSELADVQMEHQREMEGLLDSVRQLRSELLLQLLIIGKKLMYIRSELVELIQVTKTTIKKLVFMIFRFHLSKGYSC